eukprot:jgi/Mesvir1/14336/Mv09745-RA.1
MGQHDPDRKKPLAQAHARQLLHRVNSGKFSRSSAARSPLALVSRARSWAADLNNPLGSPPGTDFQQNEVVWSDHPAIMTLSPEGRIITAGHQARRIFGYEDLVGMDFDELLAPDYRSLPLSYLARYLNDDDSANRVVARTKEPSKGPHPRTSKLRPATSDSDMDSDLGSSVATPIPGGATPVQGVTTPVPGSDTTSAPPAAQSQQYQRSDTVRVVQGRRRGGGIFAMRLRLLSLAAINNSANVAVLVDVVEEALITADLRGIIVWCNRAAEGGVFGYPPGTLVGSSINRLMPEPFCVDHDGYLERYREEEGWAHLDTGPRWRMVRDKAGTVYPVVVDYRPIVSTKGEHRVQATFGDARQLEAVVWLEAVEEGEEGDGEGGGGEGEGDRKGKDGAGYGDGCGGTSGVVAGADGSDTACRSGGGDLGAEATNMPVTRADMARGSHPGGKERVDQVPLVADAGRQLDGSLGARAHVQERRGHQGEGERGGVSGSVHAPGAACSERRCEPGHAPTSMSAFEHSQNSSPVGRKPGDSSSHRADGMPLEDDTLSSYNHASALLLGARDSTPLKSATFGGLEELTHRLSVRVTMSPGASPAPAVRSGRSTSNAETGHGCSRPPATLASSSSPPSRDASGRGAKSRDVSSRVDAARVGVGLASPRSPEVVPSLLRITHCSESFEQLFGYSEAELVGRDIAEVLPDMSQLRMRLGAGEAGEGEDGKEGGGEEGAAAVTNMTVAGKTSGVNGDGDISKDGDARTGGDVGSVVATPASADARHGDNGSPRGGGGTGAGSPRGSSKRRSSKSPTAKDSSASVHQQWVAGVALERRAASFKQAASTDTPQVAASFLRDAPVLGEYRVCHARHKRGARFHCNVVLVEASSSEGEGEGEGDRGQMSRGGSQAGNVGWEPGAARRIMHSGARDNTPASMTRAVSFTFPEYREGGELQGPAPSSVQPNGAPASAGERAHPAGAGESPHMHGHKKRRRRARYVAMVSRTPVREDDSFDDETWEVGPWRIGRMLDMGGWSKVCLATHVETGELAAAKVADKAALRHELADYMIENEMLVLRALQRHWQKEARPGPDERQQHPNIEQLLDVAETSTHVVLLLELVRGSNLNFLAMCRDGVAEPQAAAYFQQVCAAVAHMHAAGVAHLDLKLANFLVEQQTQRVLVVDFGISLLMPTNDDAGAQKTEPVGSYLFAAPEVFAGTPYDARRADIWSLGICLYVLITANTFFDPLSSIEDGEMMLTPTPWNMLDRVSPSCMRLLTRLLQVDPLRRPLAKDILDDEWFTIAREMGNELTPGSSQTDLYGSSCPESPFY